MPEDPRALELRDDDRSAIRRDALAVTRALLSDRLENRLAAAHGFRPFGARGAFTQVLAEARTLLRDLLAASAGAEHAVADPEAVSRLRPRRGAPDTRRILAALTAIDEAEALAERNVNPQLIVANLHAAVSVNRPARTPGRSPG